MEIKLGRILGLMLVVAYATFGSWTDATAQEDPRAENISVADLPAGFASEFDITRGLAQAAKIDRVSVAQERRLGFVLDNRVSFINSYALGTQGGLALVASDIGLYTSVATARVAFTRGTASVRHELAAFRPTTLGSVGDADFEALAQIQANGVSRTLFLVSFVRHKSVVTLTAIGTSGSFLSSEPLRLARLIDGRIRRME